MTTQTQAEALPFEKLESLQDLHLIATHFGLERFPYMAGLARNAQDELRRLNARIAELEAQAQAQPAREPLTAEQAATNAAVLTDPLTRALYLAWAKAEPRHAVTHFPVSYFASFRDMADAARAHGITKEAA